MDAAGQVLDLAEKGQDLTIVGVLFAAIGLLLIALFFLVRHYVAQFKKTEGRCEACEKKVQALELKCHDLENGIADIALAETVEEVRKIAARIRERRTV